MSEAASTAAGHIHPLEADVSQYLRACVVLPTFRSVVEELILNALDAEATDIEVSVDLETWTVRCEDNGHGMDLSELSSSLWYSTSKRAPSSSSSSSSSSSALSYGFRGEALASISTLGDLEIRSSRKPLGEGRGGSSGREKLVTSRRDKSITFTDSSQQRLPGGREREGTVVIASNIFDNCVVRRKSMKKEVVRRVERERRESVCVSCT